MCMKPPEWNCADHASQEIQFTMHYTDTVSISLTTSYLFNYPMKSFARLPVSLTIALALFRSEVRHSYISQSPPLLTMAQVSIIPPSPNSTPALTLTLNPHFTLDLTTTSLMGSRAKLANVPKLHELIENQVRRVLAGKGPWTIPLPSFASIPDIKEEIKEEFEAKLHDRIIDNTNIGLTF